MNPVGVRIPVYPLKGYSLTLPVLGPAPHVSVTDAKRKVVYAPLDGPNGRTLRVAGMADIAGWSSLPDPARLRQLVAEARAAFPHAADYDAPLDAMAPWCGLRVRGKRHAQNHCGENENLLQSKSSSVRKSYHTGRH